MKTVLLHSRAVLGCLVIVLLLVVPSWFFYLGNKLFGKLAELTGRFVYWNWK